MGGRGKGVGMSSCRERGDWSSCGDGGYEFVQGERGVSTF
jgi:hypothetical protein